MLPPLINVRSVSKAFGAEPLFQNVSFTVSEGDRIGLIGPNGSGKSTLLRILAGAVEPDDGEIAVRKRLRLSYVEQESAFRAWRHGAICRRCGTGTGPACPVGAGNALRRDAGTRRLCGLGCRSRRALRRLAEAAGDRRGTGAGRPTSCCSMSPPTISIWRASSGWKKFWSRLRFACVVISHDRYFLENVATDMAELSRVYPDGLLRVQGRYSTFLEKKEEFLHAQSKRQEALENLVHSEIEWLRRGAKARTRKSKARIDKAGELIEELADLNTRTRSATARIDFSATDRKTKRLIELQNVVYSVAGRALFQGLNFVIAAGMRVGLVGPNGSGKTTLLRLLRGEVAATEGEIRRADRLRIVYFDQTPRARSDRYVAAGAGPGRRLGHLSGPRRFMWRSWAARFLFKGEQLNQPVDRLSGGERARVLIAQLMLQPADVLLLDEPTNDLDIPDSRNFGRESARVSRLAGAGDA